jgi:hypothetical protein
VLALLIYLCLPWFTAACGAVKEEMVGKLQILPGVEEYNVVEGGGGEQSLMRPRTGLAATPRFHVFISPVI